MEYTQLDDYALPSGTLTEWIPRVDNPASEWKFDARRLSYSHEDHCDRHRSLIHDQNRVHTANSGASWIGTVFEIHQRFDPRALRDTILAYFGRHEALRSNVAFDVESQGWRRRTVSMEAVDVERRVVPEVTTETEISEHLHRLFDFTITPLSWPHCIVATVEPEEPTGTGFARSTDSFLFVFAADHSVMDAYSQIFAISEITRLYIHALTSDDPGLPRVGSYVDYSNSERLRGESITADHRAVASWRDFLTECDGDFPAFPLPLSAGDTAAGKKAVRSGHSAPQNSLSNWLLSPELTDDFNNACRRSGYNMQTGILAALALTNRALTGRSRMRTIMPMHTRDEEQWAASVGWYVGISPLDIDLADADSFAEALGCADAGARAHKDLARYPFPRIAALLQTASVPRFVVSYIDLRFMPNAQEWQMWRGRALRSKCSAGDEVYFWVNRTPRGLNISSRFPSSGTAATNVQRFIAEFRNILTGISQSGDIDSSRNRSSVSAE